MASCKALLSADGKKIAIEKLKMAAILQFTLPGVPCVYYGDENATEGHIDPFCRTCFDWDNLNIDLIEFYKKLGQIRNRYKNIFKDGEFEEIILEKGLIVYKRKKSDKEIYIYCNNSSKSYLLNLKATYFDVLKDIKIKNNLNVKSNSYGILIRE